MQAPLLVEVGRDLDRRPVEGATPVLRNEWEREEEEQERQESTNHDVAAVLRCAAGAAAAYCPAAPGVYPATISIAAGLSWIASRFNSDAVAAFIPVTSTATPRSR